MMNIIKKVVIFFVALMYSDPIWAQPLRSQHGDFAYYLIGSAALAGAGRFASYLAATVTAEDDEAIPSSYPLNLLAPSSLARPSHTPIPSATPLVPTVMRSVMPAPTPMILHIRPYESIGRIMLGMTRAEVAAVLEAAGGMTRPAEVLEGIEFNENTFFSAFDIILELNADGKVVNIQIGPCGVAKKIFLEGAAINDDRSFFEIPYGRLRECFRKIDTKLLETTIGVFSFKYGLCFDADDDESVIRKLNIFIKGYYDDCIDSLLMFKVEDGRSAGGGSDGGSASGGAGGGSGDSRGGAHGTATAEGERLPSTRYDVELNIGVNIVTPTITQNLRFGQTLTEVRTMLGAPMLHTEQRAEAGTILAPARDHYEYFTIDYDHAENRVTGIAMIVPLAPVYLMGRSLFEMTFTDLIAFFREMDPSLIVRPAGSSFISKILNLEVIAESIKSPSRGADVIVFFPKDYWK
ncbi:MAG: hypothetical protein J0G29_07815 [Alphaproteobacteria bacterium]|nr:hypothetical protein [Alphaproteobacteria bacterium]